MSQSDQQIQLSNNYSELNQGETYTNDIESPKKYNLASKLNKFSFPCFGIAYMLPWNSI